MDAGLDMVGQLAAKGGGWALLGAVVWLIATGRLVPRSALLDTQAERDKWYEAAQTAMRQNNQLLTGARVTHEVLQSLPSPSDATGGPS